MHCVYSRLTSCIANRTIWQRLWRSCWNLKRNTSSPLAISPHLPAQNSSPNLTTCSMVDKCCIGMNQGHSALAILTPSSCSGFDVHEVFSRGQNPQHWHISRRGLGQNGESTHGEVFMEVARKESTLTDVDNELAGIVRRFLE